MHLARKVLDRSDHVRRHVQLLEDDAVLEAADPLDFVAVEMQLFQFVAAEQYKPLSDMIITSTSSVLTW